MKWTVILAVASGIVSGIVATLVASHLSDSGRRSASPEVVVAPAVSGDLARRIEHLESQQLKQGMAASKPSAEAAAQPATDDKKPESASFDERPRADVYFAEKLAEHRSEAVDPDWAPTAQKNLAIDVDRMVAQTKLPVRVGAVHCATTTCTVDLEWPNFTEARRTYAEFVHTNEYAINCGRGLVLPDPPRPDDAYRATLLLTCEDDRTAQNDRIRP